MANPFENLFSKKKAPVDLENEILRFSLYAEYNGQKTTQLFPNAFYPNPTISSLQLIIDQFKDNFINSYCDYHPGSKIGREDINVVYTPQTQDLGDVADRV